MQQSGNLHSGVSRIILSIALQLLRSSAIFESKYYATVLHKIETHRACYGTPAICLPIERLISMLNLLIDLPPAVTIMVDDAHLLGPESGNPQIQIPDESRAIVAYLKQLFERPQVSIILVSRHSPWLAASFPSSRSLQITPDLTNRDISLVMEQQTSDSSLPTAVSEDVRISILRDAQGSWVKAILLCKGLDGAKSVSDHKVWLSEHPQRLCEMYRNLCAKKEETLSHRDAARRHKIVKAMAAATRPLHVEVINELLAFDPSRSATSDDERLLDPTSSILNLCEPLLEVDEEVVHFCHQSAKDFAVNNLVSIQDDPNTFMLDICVSKLTEQTFMEVEYCSRLLQDNLLIQSVEMSAERTVAGESGLYNHATLHWQEYLVASQRLSPDLWGKINKFLHTNSFVSWSENLFILRGRSGLDAQVDVGTSLRAWYDRLTDDSKPDISVESFLVQPYISISRQLRNDTKEPLLQFLALIRPGHYLNLSGRTEEDFQQALDLKRRVADGFVECRGPRDRNTLFARRTYYQELQGFGRPDEALAGYKDILEIQREDLDEESIDIFDTLAWIGNACHLLARFGESRKALQEAIVGYQRIYGKSNKAYLFVSMALGFTVEAQGDLVEAATRYRDIYDKWIPSNGNSSGFSATLLTAYGSLLRKQGEYGRAAEFLFEAFGARLRLYTLTSEATVDSGLHLAVLYRQMRQASEAKVFLKQVQDSEAFDVSFERQCQLGHIRALADFDLGEYEMPRNALTKLVMMSIGDNRDKNNRELLWTRLDLADALRAHDESDAVPVLFTELVTSTTSTSRRSSLSGWSVISNPSQEIILDGTEDLETAEQALRLTRDKHEAQAAELLASKGLRWVRQKDFWILGGDPKVDTDLVRYDLAVSQDSQVESFATAIHALRAKFEAQFVLTDGVGSKPGNQNAR
jgi:tetratricopeptide (TPR) repeat protein